MGSRSDLTDAEWERLEPLHHHRPSYLTAGHVHAVDIEPAMISEGRKAAAAHGIGNITWACGDAAGLTGMGLPPLDLCTMGKSFQWMNQDRLLADLDTLIRPGGGIALVSTGPRASTVRPASSTAT